MGDHAVAGAELIGELPAWLYCTQCGQSLGELSSADVCRHCAQPVSQSLALWRVAGQELRVTRWCPCVDCKYDLLTQSARANCPECAVPVQHSLTPTDLPDADPGWLATQTRGVHKLFVAAVAMVLGAIVLFVVGYGAAVMQMANSGWALNLQTERAKGLLQLVGIVLSAQALALLLRPRPRGPATLGRFAHHGTRRDWVLYAALLGLALATWGATIPLLGLVAHAYYHQIPTVLGQWLIGLAALTLLWRLARRGGYRELALHTTLMLTLAWLVLALAAVYVAADQTVQALESSYRQIDLYRQHAFVGGHLPGHLRYLPDRAVLQALAGVTLPASLVIWLTLLLLAVPLLIRYQRLLRPSSPTMPTRSASEPER